MNAEWLDELKRAIEDGAKDGFNYVEWPGKVIPLSVAREIVAMAERLEPVGQSWHDAYVGAQADLEFVLKRSAEEDKRIADLEAAVDAAAQGSIDLMHELTAQAEEIKRLREALEAVVRVGGIQKEHDGRLIASMISLASSVLAQPDEREGKRG